MTSPARGDGRGGSTFALFYATAQHCLSSSRVGAGGLSASTPLANGLGVWGLWTRSPSRRSAFSNPLALLAAVEHLPNPMLVRLRLPAGTGTLSEPMDRTEEGRVRAAFPRYLEADVSAIFRILPAPIHETSSDDIGLINVGADAVSIPARVYFSEPAAADMEVLSERQRLITRCLLSRHHDGHVRERMVKHVLGYDETWTVPFVVQLVGEYVLEIIRRIEDGLRPEHQEPYGAFLRDNADFWARTRQRVVSYWNCYYRHEFPDRLDYPGMRLSERFERWRLHACEVSH